MHSGLAIVILSLGVCLPAARSTEAADLPPSTEGSDRQIGASEVTERFGSSVVLIQAELQSGQTPTGSGFFVAPDGVIATSLHLLDGARSIMIVVGGKRIESVRILTFDIEKDLALIQIDSLGSEAVVTGDASTLKRGDPIFVISNPLGLAGTVSEGIVSAWREPPTGEVDDLDPMSRLYGLPQVRLLQISAPVSQGSSGAPVFDAYGRVVGVVAAGLGKGALDLNFAVPIGELVHLLEVDEGWDLAGFQYSLDRRRQDLATPHLQDARYYLARAELEEASRALDRALGVFPRSAEALILKADVLVITGHIEEAGRVLYAVTEANPDSAEAWEKLGHFLLEHRPSSPTSFRVGELAPLTPRLAEAIAAFEKALEIDPWRAGAAFGLAQALVETGRLPEAREMLERALESDRDHIQALMMLGNLCIVLGDLRAAEEALENAVWLDPDNPQAHHGLAIVYREKGEASRSQQHWQRYQELRARQP